MILLTKKTQIQSELHAIHQIVSSLSPLDAQTRKRVLDYALSSLPMDANTAQPTVGKVAGNRRNELPQSSSFKASPLVNA